MEVRSSGTTSGSAKTQSPDLQQADTTESSKHAIHSKLVANGVLMASSACYKGKQSDEIGTDETSLSTGRNQRPPEQSWV